MPQTDTEPRVELTTLRARDAAPVRRWLRDFHRAHGRAWVGALNLGWAHGETDAQLLAADIVERYAEALFVAARRDDALVVVARLGERPIGALWLNLSRQDHLAVPVGVVQWVYVSEWARGNRVGSALMEAGREWLRMRGVRGFQVSVLVDNEPAMRLYQRAGLRVADVRMMGSVDPVDEGPAGGASGTRASVTGR
jgi:ribosomal protein S18 acetylase RimI-like enzyme